MCYNPWGCKELDHDLATEQQQHQSGFICSGSLGESNFLRNQVGFGEREFKKKKQTLVHTILQRKVNTLEICQMIVPR